MNRPAALGCVLCVVVVLGVMPPAHADWSRIANPPDGGPPWLGGGKALPAAAPAPLRPEERLQRYLSRTLGLAGAPRVHPAQNGGGVTTRVSVDSAGNQGNNASSYCSISADGRYVAFCSYANNLVPGDTNGLADIFVHDRATGETTRVSVDSVGNQGNGEGWYSSISADGRYVAFESSSNNLVPGDTNSTSDVFVHDRVTGQTTRVSVDSAGNQGNYASYQPSISADGRYVAFESNASNLVPGDTNSFADVFVHDCVTGETTRVSVDSAGNQGNDGSSFEPSISADGRYVAFAAWATSLVPGDTNFSVDIFVHDRVTGGTTRVSVDSAGNQANFDSWWPSISADGRFVAFASEAYNLIPGDTNLAEDVFVHDTVTGATTRVSVDSTGNQGDGGGLSARISGDGRYVAFDSYSTNLVPGDTNDARDVFVHDRQTGETARVSVNGGGDQGNLDAWRPSISADGQHVAFQSWATNLVPGDTNDVMDVFVRGSQVDLPVRIVETGERYPTIQAAINAAMDGQTVEASPGTYYENINFSGKNISVRSEDPDDPDVVAATIIDGGGAGSVVTFDSGETEEAVLAGFTITNGQYYFGGGIVCGDESDPTITRNVITGNAATHGGGGIFCVESSPTITHNNITGNQADWGAGIAGNDAGPTITHNLIAGNGATHGGGLMVLAGQGTNGGQADIRNNTFSHNTTYEGGSLEFEGGYNGNPAVLTNNIIAFDTTGHGVAVVGDDAPVIAYCNVYGNHAGNYTGMPDPTGTAGNISADPLFAAHPSSDGDFHLKSLAGRWNPALRAWVIDTVHSPCIDAGDPKMPVGDEPLPHGDRINMGAYGGTEQASKSWTDSLPAPSVTSIAPASAINNGPVDVTITGANFRAGATTKLTRQGEDDIPGTHLKVVSGTEITCTFDLDGAAAGMWDVVVTSKDEQSGTLGDGFEVQHAQPDALIRNHDEDDYVGHEVYNTTGEDQTREQHASPENPAVFHVKFVNHGTIPDRFVVTNRVGMIVGAVQPGNDAPEAQSDKKKADDWTVRYYAGLDPNAEDITRQVTGDGWLSDELEALRGAQVIRVEMTPDRATPGHAAREALVTVRSIAAASRLDAVKAIAHNIPRRQPDLHVQRPVEGDLVGDDVYNDTGAGQTADHASDGAAPAAYRVLLQNDGNVPDRFTITARHAAGGASLAHWRVSVLDAPTDGVDISNQVLGEGWTSPQLPMGDIMELRLEVTPEDAARAGAACALLLHAHSATEMARRDAVLLHTTKTATHRPDMLIRPADEADYLGDDVYSDDGAGQTATQTTPAGLAATYHLRVVNKGNCPDEYLITAPALVTTATAAPTGWTVRLFDALTGGADITDAVLGEGWRTPELAAAGSHELRLEVTPDSTLPGDAMLDALITATSAAHAAAADTVKAVTHNAADYQPDMLIRNAGDTDYVGGGIYNTNAAGQSKAQVVNGGLAVYHLRARNDGNVPQRLNVTAVVHEVGTSADRGPAWSTTFFDAPEGGHEITEQIRGAGWQTDVLHPGEAVDLRLETRLGPDVPGNATQRTLVTATSADDPVASDTVRATTSKAPVNQPDLVIRNAGDADFVGPDIFNETGEGQTKAQTVPMGTAAVYDVQVHNAGNVAEAYLITLPGGAADGWEVRLFDAPTGGDDITAQVTGDGWMTPELPPGEFHALRVEATPGPAAGPLAVCRALLRAASPAEGGGADAVRADTTRAAVHQPDLIICAAPDGPCVGEGIHNETGEAQTLAQTVAASVTAPFHVTIRNDGDRPDRFKITAPGDGWALLWRDAPTGGGADITAAITGDGYTTPELAPTEQHTLLLHVTPGEGVHGGAVLELTVRAVSLAEPARIDVVKAVAEMTRISRPDMLIRCADETDYAGDGLYNDTGDGQGRVVTVAGDTAAVFHLMLRNAGNAAEEFLVTLDGGILPAALVEARWTIALYDALSGGADVTDAALGGGWRAGPLDPQAALEFRLEIRPGVPVPGREAWEALLTATSAQDPGKSDTVKATTIKRRSQPDAMIRRPADADYLGEGVINDTAEGQTAARSVTLTAGAAYLLRVRNAGNMPDSFIITSPAQSGGGWQVAFFDAAIGGADITADVTSAGWTAGPLEPGEAANLRLEVTAHTAEALAASQETLVTATSTGDPAAADTVAALTTLLPPTPMTATPDAGVWLLGVPGLPLNPRADAVFGVPNVVRWDAAAQDYVHFAHAPFDVIPGHGYWARFPAGHELSFDGYPLDAPPTVDVAPGWNLLGNSLSHSLPWSAVTATGDVDAYAWKLNAQGTDYVLVWSLAGLNWETEIGPWEGFWLRAREHCAVTLGAAQAAHDAQHPTVPAPAWVIQLRARAGEAVDGSNFVGVAGGNAPLYVHAPPPLAGSRVSLHVDAAGERYAVSLVGEADRTAWDLVARTDLPDTQVEITLPDLSQVPGDLAVTLTDLAAGRTVNMRTSTGYAFASGPEGGERRFRLEVKPRVMQAPVITALAAQPTASGVQVVYTLSAEAEVAMEVLNIAGRTVARIPAGRREAGTHTALWSGRALGGAPTPPGRYLVTVRCAAEDGTQNTRVVPVHTNR